MKKETAAIGTSPRRLAYLKALSEAPHLNLLSSVLETSLFIRLFISRSFIKIISPCLGQKQSDTVVNLSYIMSSEGQSELNLHSMNIAFHSVSVSITTLSDISWVESVPTARGNLTLRWPVCC